ncbi:MAG: toxin-activating lysine-acyltransferase [Roseateles sp.]
MKLTRECTMLDPERQRVVGAVSLILAEQEGWRGDLRTLLAEEILPCARHGKIAFFLNFDRVPVGFVTWAHLSEETEQRLLTTMDPWLHLSEWNEGPSPWIRWLHLPQGFRREGLRLCLDELFPDAPSVRVMFRRKAAIMALELERPVIERLARLTR